MNVTFDKQLHGIKLSDSDIVPEEYQNILIYLRDSITSACFTIGDVANELVSKSLDVGMPVTDQRIFEAVGKYCGKSPRTVRYYAETSAFFDKEVRQEYETLPFSFFVFARSMNGKWKEVLDFASINQGSTLDYLRYIFLTQIEKDDSSKIGEISQDIDGVEDGKIREISQDLTRDTGSGEISQNNRLIEKYSLISAISRYIEAARTLVDVMADSGANMDKIGVEISIIRESIESASIIAKQINSMYNEHAG